MPEKSNPCISHFPILLVSGPSTKPWLATPPGSTCDCKGCPDCQTHPSLGTPKETGRDMVEMTRMAKHWSTRGNKMQCYPLQNTCRMCNCHQTELSDQASKSQTPTLRTKKKKLLQEIAENKPQTGVTFYWEDTPATRNSTGKHHCWLPEGKLAIFTLDLRTGESRPPCPQTHHG